MDDRALLEAAAKAAGIHGFWADTGINMDSCVRPSIWNPLTSDADALRLAVSLNLKTVFHPVLRQALVWRYLASGDEWIENLEDHDDPCAATRRCIVRAAAAIGEGA